MPEWQDIENIPIEAPMSPKSRPKPTFFQSMSMLGMVSLYSLLMPTALLFIIKVKVRSILTGFMLYVLIYQLVTFRLLLHLSLLPYPNPYYHREYVSYRKYFH